MLVYFLLDFGENVIERFICATTIKLDLTTSILVAAITNVVHQNCLILLIIYNISSHFST